MRNYLLLSLFVGGVVIGCGFSPSSAQAQQQTTDAQVAALVEALRQAAPQTGKTNDGLYSAWQVKPETFRGWSKTCLKREVTPTQFENNPTLARQVVSCITRRELNQQFRATNNNETAAVSGVACWWMTGAYTGCNTGFTATYVQKVVRFYQQQRSQSTANPTERSL
ncbi:hypothetical protein [Anabaena subtropica]|uniref:Uncharacterized protein n=1 Tax=Anabaena subtropica FACHB-260 TaxID=2692884 RepID=A0ABR8CV22_9NOST|nr:hypothetical protein [Anabaena subtropica]MBD2347047.1 hypothetical protein [Anabaena subtropica FACHB-260]